MLELKNFNTEALKAEMKKAKAEKHRQNNKLRFMYSSKETTPVKVGEIIINYTIYKRLISKLKGFNVTTELKDNTLVVQYVKNDAKVTGCVLLEDMSQYFKDFKHIPVAELRNGQKT